MDDDLPHRIKKGDIVAFPTETVYGLGASAFNPDAIKKVFSIKGRPSDNPLIVHVSDYKMVYDFVEFIPQDARLLMDTFWPGPLTVILPKKPAVLDIITAGLESVAIRMPNHQLALEFISKTGPLVAPSANLSGKPSPTKAEHVKQDFGLKVPVLDGGPCQIGLESTVIDMCSEPYTILRPGHITSLEIQNVLGKQVEMINSEETESPRSPGMKYSHYSPNAEVRWLRDGELPSDISTMYLYIISNGIIPCLPNVKWYANDFQAFARDLYDRFRQADLQGYKEIAIERFEGQDALINRIDKAIGVPH